MKKTFLFSVILALICTFSFAQKGYNVKFSQPTSTEYQLSFSVTDWDIQTVQYDGVNFQQIVFSSSALTQEKGWAELPLISASIQLPAQKNVDLSIIYTEFTDYLLDFPLVPSRGVIYRNQDQTTIPYVIDPESVIDQFYPGNLATADEPYIIRDVRGTSVRICPFQYNAVANTLRIYTKVETLLTENNEPATNPLLKENPNPIREVRGMYKSIFMNYQESRIPLTMAEYGDILVITTDRDEDAIQPYIDWKREKGYNVEKEVVAQGTNVKSLIQAKYTENQNLMYVQLVGAWADIKCDVFTTTCDGYSSQCPTDPMLGDVVGSATDYRPDISIGRMSANSAAQVTVQVNKTIQYEKNPNMDASWYSSFIGIGSNDTGPADDGEKDWLHIQRIYEERLEPTYDYNTHYRLYENESGCNKNNLINYINTGVSTIAYCGHGSSTSFVTTGLNNNDVNNLQNGQKMPFIVSVACAEGAIHKTVCFAETWLRKEDGGAVVTWMSSMDQPWAPPMRGQDYFYDVLIGGFDYTQYSGQNGINTDELRTHWGAIVVNAANLMLSEYNTTSDKETVRTWATFGDPSLQLRTKQPVELASSIPVITVGTFETTITANGDPVKDALVCISQDGVYYSAFTDEDGVVTIENDFLPGEALLVVTAFNTTTIYETMPVGGDLIMNAPLNLTSIVENANHILLNWDEPQGSSMPVKGYNIYRNDELITLEPVREEHFYTDIVPTNGEYTYTVTALYNNSGSMESEPSDPKTVTIDGMCVSITDKLEVAQTEEEEINILISWKAPEYDGTELAGYNIYRNDEQINTEIVTELSYVDENLEPFTEYCYQVEVVYNDCEETLKSKQECLTTLSVKDISGANNFVIYPNPANNELRVTSYELQVTSIEIYDIYGRNLTSHTSYLTPHTSLDISDLSAGLYFVKIYTETNDFAVKRLVIMK